MHNHAKRVFIASVVILEFCCLMPHCHSLAAQALRRERAIRLGYLKSKTGSHAVAQRTSDIAGALVAHRDLDLFNGFHCHSASRALSAASKHLPDSAVANYKGRIVKGNSARHAPWFSTAQSCRWADADERCSTSDTDTSPPGCGAVEHAVPDLPAGRDQEAEPTPPACLRLPPVLPAVPGLHPAPDATVPEEDPLLACDPWWDAASALCPRPCTLPPGGGASSGTLDPQAATILPAARVDPSCAESQALRELISLQAASIQAQRETIDSMTKELDGWRWQSLAAASQSQVADPSMDVPPDSLPGTSAASRGGVLPADMEPYIAYHGGACGDLLLRTVVAQVKAASRCCIQLREDLDGLSGSMGGSIQASLNQRFALMQEEFDDRMAQRNHTVKSELEILNEAVNEKLKLGFGTAVSECNKFATTFATQATTTAASVRRNELETAIKQLETKLLEELDKRSNELALSQPTAAALRTGATRPRQQLHEDDLPPVDAEDRENLFLQEMNAAADEASMDEYSEEPQEEPWRQLYGAAGFDEAGSDCDFGLDAVASCKTSAASCSQPKPTAAIAAPAATEITWSR